MKPDGLGLWWVAASPCVQALSLQREAWAGTASPALGWASPGKLLKMPVPGAQRAIFQKLPR